MSKPTFYVGKIGDKPRAGYVGIPTHFHEQPEVIQFQNAFGPTSDAMLVRLFFFIAELAPSDGILHGVSASNIENAVGFSGTPGVLVESLVERGFLNRNEDSFAIPRWGTNKRLIDPSYSFEDNAHASN